MMMMTTMTTMIMRMKWWWTLIVDDDADDAKDTQADTQKSFSQKVQAAFKLANFFCGIMFWFMVIAVMLIFTAIFECPLVQHSAPLCLWHTVTWHLNWVDCGERDSCCVYLALSARTCCRTTPTWPWPTSPGEHVLVHMSRPLLNVAVVNLDLCFCVLHCVWSSDSFLILSCGTRSVRKWKLLIWTSGETLLCQN